MEIKEAAVTLFNVNGTATKSTEMRLCGVPPSLPVFLIQYLILTGVLAQLMHSVTYDF